MVKGISNCNSKSFIWQRCTCRTYVLEEKDAIIPNGDCSRETKSVIKMQRRYRTQYGKAPPSDNAIRRWLKQFQETGSVLHRTKGAGRPSTSQEDFERIQEAWTSYVKRKALILKLFSILQYSFHI
jgi:hypothetical protein